MEKEFVAYKQALELKELGFDEKCIKGFYNKEEIFTTVSTPVDFNNKKQLGELISAPLWQQSFDWFREKYNLDPQIKSWTERNTIVWYISTEKIGEPSRFKCYEVSVSTYEEARLECLKKLIQIVKTQ